MKLAKTLFKALLPGLIFLALCLPASAAVTLLDQDGTTFTVDGYFNTFYVYTASKANAEADAAGFGTDVDQDQSRVKMGFLPNYIGFNFSKQQGDLKIGGRASFWVTINDSDDSPTGTSIDVRQFYGTVDGNFGQVLIGKDFGLFNRSNIFLDEILLGFGNEATGINTDGVSLGNIGTGYTYPLPSAQITYRTPELAGLKLAVGVIDPSHTSGAGGEEKAPRVEGELTYNLKLDPVSITAWTGFLWQYSEKGATGNVESQGFSYGLQVKAMGLSLTGSGYTGQAVGALLGPGVLDNAVDADGDERDSDGYLLQGSYTIGPVRLVASYGQNEVEIDGASDYERSCATGGVFYTINDNLKIVAEYSKQEEEQGSAEVDTNIFALGGVIMF
ncbi:MAG: porin [Desulfuromonadaceae bacterium]